MQKNIFNSVLNAIQSTKHGTIPKFGPGFENSNRHCAGLFMRRERMLAVVFADPGNAAFLAFWGTRQAHITPVQD